MKKLVITLLAATALTSVFAAPKSSNPAIFPMDSFDPNKFTASNITEFVKKYSSEADVVLKKGEFETTAEYEERLAKGLKTKSLDSEKIYAFKLDSISVKYNPDNAQYNVSIEDTITNGRLFGDSFSLRKKTKENNLRIGKVSRTSNRYKASNAYGKMATVISVKGKDFYIRSQKPFYNVNSDSLTFSTDIDVAKKNASCNKQVYVFAKLNGETYKNNPYDFAAVQVPKINSPVDIQIIKYTIPMEIVGMVLKCSTGTILSVYESVEKNTN